MSTFWTTRAAKHGDPASESPAAGPGSPDVSGPSSALLAGASRVLITPPLGRPLAGYPQRKERSSFIHDDLYLRALVLADESGRYGLLSLDVMAVDVGWVEELRRRAEAELGIPPDHLLVAATHTHSGHGELLSFTGPIGAALDTLFGESEGPHDPVAYEYLLRQALTGLRLAHASLSPARLRLGSDELEGLASNRIDAAAGVDRRCVVASLEGERTGPIATIVHFTCHPSVLGDGDAGVSADFPGVACRVVETAVGGVALFLNGALGDVSTRFTRTGHGYEEAVRFGRMLGGTALRALATSRPIDRPALSAAVSVIELPPKDQRWVADAGDRAAHLRDQLHRAEAEGIDHGHLRQLKTALQGAEIALALGPRLAALESVTLSVQRFDLGRELTLVAFPAELFSGLGMRLTQAHPEKTVLAVGPANGYLGYIPTEDAFDASGYEADTCIVDRGAGEQLVSCVLEQLL